MNEAAADSPRSPSIMLISVQPGSFPEARQIAAVEAIAILEVPMILFQRLREDREISRGYLESGQHYFKLSDSSAKA